MFIYLNKNTLEVINEERFEQLVDDEFDKVNKRRTAVKAELETIYRLRCAPVEEKKDGSNS